MKWIEFTFSDTTPAPRHVALIEQALEQFPDKVHVRQAAAQQFAQHGLDGKAIELFEALVADDEIEGIDWLALSRCYLRTGQAGLALATLDRPEAAQDERSVRHFSRGRALLALKRVDEAIVAFLRAAEAGPGYHDPCLAILDIHAQRHDGQALLEASRKLEARFGDSSVFRTGRAVGLSMLGRAGEAAQLIDLDRHVMVLQLGEVWEGDLSALNAELRREARAMAEVSFDIDVMIQARPPLEGRSAHRQLSLIVREAIEAYLKEADQRGLDHCLPLPIERAALLGGVTILRGDGHNGQHIHRESVISAVYHVEVPEAVSQASDDRGGLLLGATDQFAQGCQACWGTRVIKPRAGQLTIFPAHIHHDVIPSQCEELRISMPFDVHLIG